jgi:fructose-specific phosphotransferase system component IIB
MGLEAAKLSVVAITEVFSGIAWTWLCAGKTIKQMANKKKMALLTDNCYCR